MVSGNRHQSSSWIRLIQQTVGRISPSLHKRLSGASRGPGRSSVHRIRKHFDSTSRQHKKRIRTSRNMLGYWKVIAFVFLITSSKLFASARAIYYTSSSGMLVGLGSEEFENFEVGQEGSGCCSYETRSEEDGTGSIFPAHESEYSAGEDSIVEKDDGREDLGFEESPSHFPSTTEDGSTDPENETQIPAIYVGIRQVEFEYLYQGPFSLAGKSKVKTDPSPPVTALLNTMKYTWISSKTNAKARDESGTKVDLVAKSNLFQSILHILGNVMSREAPHSRVSAETKEPKKKTNLDLASFNVKPELGDFRMFDDLHTDSDGMADYYTTKELNSSGETIPLAGIEGQQNVADPNDTAGEEGEESLPDAMPLNAPAQIESPVK